MPLPIIVNYPLDLTGIEPDNLVQSEPHSVSPTHRAIALQYGPFYGDTGLLLRNASNGQPLVKGDDYVAAVMHQDATTATGLAVYCAIVINNLNLTDVLVTYQVVGGEYSTSAAQIADLIASIAVDNRPIEWGSLLGLPTAFTPAPHIHSAGDLYGFEYIVDVLEDIKNAILIGDQQSHEEIYEWVSLQLLGVGSSTATADAITAAMQASMRMIYDLSIDLFGPAMFIDNGFKLLFNSSAWTLQSGTAYVQGVRAYRSTALPVSNNTYPASLWLVVKAPKDGANNTVVIDYVWGAAGASSVTYNNANGYPYYTYKISEVTSTSVYSDLRIVRPAGRGLAFSNENPLLAVTVNSTLARNKKYLVNAGLNVLLPPVSGLSVGDYVEVQKGVDGTVTVGVNNPGGDIIKTYNSSNVITTDIAVNMQVLTKATFIWMGTYWKY